MVIGKSRQRNLNKCFSCHMWPKIFFLIKTINCHHSFTFSYWLNSSAKWQNQLFALDRYKQVGKAQHGNQRHRVPCSNRQDAYRSLSSQLEFQVAEAWSKKVELSRTNGSLEIFGCLDHVLQICSEWDCFFRLQLRTKHSFHAGGWKRERILLMP